MTNMSKINAPLPTYHPYDDSFINDPMSMKFKFTCSHDIRHNNLECAVEALEGMRGESHSKKKTRSLRVKYENTTNHARERPIPKMMKKKYPTKPKDIKKIQKMKARSDKYDLL